MNMKKRSMWTMLLLPFFFFSCNNSPYEKTDDGVIVNLAQDSTLAVKKIRLQIVTDDIIHVTATPDSKFPEKKSLMTIYEKTLTSGWDVTEEGDNVVLKTATTKAIVSLKTGEVSFTDLEGNTLLAENKGGGKTFRT